MSRVVSLLSLGLLVATVGCGPEEGLLLATFTSDVIQLDTCRLVEGEDRELCTREDVSLRLRVTLIEEADDRVWIQGVPIDGENDRRILGTRDSEGGFLFSHRITRENQTSGCTIETELSLALRIDAEASAETIGVDDCVPLLGREERRVHTTLECDDVNDPQEAQTRIIRRRWERAPLCGDDDAITE